MRDLFAAIEGVPQRTERRWYTLPFSILVHALILAVVVATPLVATGALPTPPSSVVFTMPAVPPPPSVPRAPAPPPPAATTPTPATVPVATIPLEAPPAILPEVPMSLPAISAVPGAIAIGSGSSTGVTLAAPPIAIPPPVAPELLRPGGQIKEPRKIFHVPPVYPQIAQRARAAGVVVIEATIGIDGRVTEARILKSVPLLDQAAVDAVKQWRYSPTMLNGSPVAILMTVTVVFSIK